MFARRGEICAVFVSFNPRMSEHDCRLDLFYLIRVNVDGTKKKNEVISNVLSVRYSVVLSVVNF